MCGLLRALSAARAGRVADAMGRSARAMPGLFAGRVERVPAFISNCAAKS